MKNNRRTRVTDLQGAMWPTCDQERELHCIPHITDPVHVRRFDGVQYDFELHMNNEAVAVFVPQIVAHWVAVKVLAKADMLVILDDGNKIMYVG